MGLASTLHGALGFVFICCVSLGALQARGVRIACTRQLFVAVLHEECGRRPWPFVAGPGREGKTDETVRRRTLEGPDGSFRYW